MLQHSKYSRGGKAANQKYLDWPVGLGYPQTLKGADTNMRESLEDMRKKRLRQHQLQDIVPEQVEKKDYEAQMKFLFSKGDEKYNYEAPELKNAPRCTCRFSCKSAPATKKCFNCIKFDSAGKGYYCDECFVARHPAYRAEHKWEPIEDVTDPQCDYLRQVARCKLEQDMGELRILLDQARTFCEEVENLGIDLRKDRGIKNAYADIEVIDSSICDMINHVQHELKVKYLTKGEAIIKIQEMWKIRKARKTLRDMIRNVYQRFLDPDTGKYFYYNKITGEKQWFKPLTLGSEDFEKPKPKKRIALAVEMDDDMAATFIQRAFRAWRSIELIHEMIQNVFKKILDPTTKKYYYHNLRTGEVSWTKPKLLGSRDILTPRSKAAAQRAKRRKRRTGPLSNSDAAIMIQRMMRSHAFRIHYRKLITSVYEKIWDEKVNAFYYYNTRTKNVSWTRPANVEDEHLLTPRSRKAFLHQDRQNKRRVARTAESITPLEAACMIQRVIRSYRFRKYYRKLISSVYEKILDAATGKYYYYNTRTKNVSWTRPANVEDEHLLTPRSRRAFLREDRHNQRAARTGDLTESEAACIIQRVIRSYRFRKYYRKLISSVYEKIMDAATGKYYYYNTRTKSVSWTRPANVEDEHLLTPRSRRAFLREDRHNQRRAARTGGLTESEAACMIQRVIRSYRFRKYYRKLISSVYEKILDTASGKYYYYNSRTESVSWTRPANVEDEHLMTPRTREAHLNSTKDD